MEVAPPQSGLAHVMRHSFKPSDHLAIALENYLQPGVTRPRIFLHATRLVRLSVDKYETSEVVALHSAINKDFTKRHREKLFLGRTAIESGVSPRQRFMARQLGEGILRVGFVPNDEQKFKEYLSRFDPLDTATDLGAKNLRGYLYADLPMRSVDSNHIQHNTQAIAETLDSVERARLLYVSPGMVSLDTISEANREQGSASDD